MSVVVFREELERLINTHSMENGSGTPDFILAQYLVACLEAYDAAVYRRTQWMGGASPMDEGTVHADLHSEMLKRQKKAADEVSS